MTTPAINPFLEDDSDLEGEKLALRWLPVERIPLLLWAENPKKHSLSEIWESIVKFGFIDPPKFDTQLKNRNGEWGAIQYGNGRSEAVHWGWEAYKRGDYQGAIPKGISVDKEGMWYIPVKVGINAENEAMASDFGVFHNTSTMLGGDFEDGDIWRLFDAKELLKIGKTVLSNKDFEPLAMTGEEVDSLLKFIEGDKNEPSGDSEAQLNRAEEWKVKWGVEQGQLWQIGRHRLFCGDSYIPENIERLLNGETPDLLNTDPPYGINIVKPEKGERAAAIGGSKAFGSTGETKRKGDKAVAFRNRKENRVELGHVQHGSPSKNQWAKNHPSYLPMKGDVGRVAPSNIVQSNIYPVIEGDDTPFEPEFLLGLAPIIVLWGANYYTDKLPISSGWIVWDKRENLARNNFADCELAWTNQSKPARIFYHLWNGLHKGSQHGERRVHPTEKPVALFAEIGNLLAPNGLWLDLFAGSGSQLVAAEQNNATCFAIEYEPLYVATILQRLADLGLEPYKAD